MKTVMKTQEKSEIDLQKKKKKRRRRRHWVDYVDRDKCPKMPTLFMERFKDRKAWEEAMKKSRSEGLKAEKALVKEEKKSRLKRRKQGKQRKSNFKRCEDPRPRMLGAFEASPLLDFPIIGKEYARRRPRNIGKSLIYTCNGSNPSK